MRTYQHCQLSLLHEEIRQKKSNIRVLLKEFQFLHSTLQTEISFIDFAYIRSLFLGTIQQKKFNNLLKDKKPQHDPEKIIFNYSSFVLSEAEKSLLQKGLNLSIQPEKLNHADYLDNLELFYGDICNLQVLSREDLDFTKTKSKDMALFSFCTYNNNVTQHLKTNKSSFKNLTKVILQLWLIETNILKRWRTS